MALDTPALDAPALPPPVHGINRILPSSMRYGHFRFYWLGLLVGVTGHQMLLNFTLGWLMFQLTGEERDLRFWASPSPCQRYASTSWAVL